MAVEISLKLANPKMNLNKNDFLKVTFMKD